MTTLHEISTVANVASATISRVLNIKKLLCLIILLKEKVLKI